MPNHRQWSGDFGFGTEGQVTVSSEVLAWKVAENELISDSDDI